jgi:hypothetical protein
VVIKLPLLENANPNVKRLTLGYQRLNIVVTVNVDGYAFVRFKNKATSKPSSQIQ